MTIYLTENLGILVGPVQPLVVPGMGTQLPGNAIELAKPLAIPKKDHIWVLVNGKPQQVIDQRGTVYRTDTGAQEHYSQLGVLPAEYTTIPKPPFSRWEAGQWVPDLQPFHQQQIEAINSACTAAIMRGFWSSALDAPHLYSSELDDQLNLNGVIVIGDDTIYACRDVEGRREYRPHTVEQLRQVGQDFASYRLSHLLQADRFKRQLDDALAAGDLAALQSVVWQDPQP